MITMVTDRAMDDNYLKNLCDRMIYVCDAIKEAVDEQSRAKLIDAHDEVTRLANTIDTVIELRY